MPIAIALQKQTQGGCGWRDRASLGDVGEQGHLRAPGTLGEGPLERTKAAAEGEVLRLRQVGAWEDQHGVLMEGSLNSSPLVLGERLKAHPRNGGAQGSCAGLNVHRGVVPDLEGRDATTVHPGHRSSFLVRNRCPGRRSATRSQPWPAPPQVAKLSNRHAREENPMAPANWRTIRPSFLKGYLLVYITPRP